MNQLSTVCGELQTTEHIIPAFEAIALAEAVLAKMARAIRVEANGNMIHDEDCKKIKSILDKAF